MKNKITAKYIGISHLFNLSALENQILKEKITGLYESLDCEQNFNGLKHKQI